MLSGVGRAQKAGEAVRTPGPGDTVRIGAGEKHWHGAARDRLFVHRAVEEVECGSAVTWLEAVADIEYGSG